MGKYICDSDACESYYEFYKIEYPEDQLVLNNIGDKCCPKCGEKLTLLDDYLEEQKKWEIEKKKKLFLKIGIAIALLAISFGIYNFVASPSISGNIEISVPKTTDTIAQKEATSKDTVVVEKTLPKDTVVIEKTIIKQTVNETVNTAVPHKETSKKTVAVSNHITPKGTQSKTFAGGSKYVGNMVKGQMHGLGTYTYGQRELISTRDSKNRYAEAGDYIIGQFECGNVVSGKLYDRDNNLKEVVIIGGTGCTP
jgi:hypothetical protein